MDIKTSKKLFPSQRQMGKTSAPTHWHLHGGGGHWEPVKTRSHTRSMAHAWAATTVYGGIILIFFEAFITALFVLVLWSVQPIFRTQKLQEHGEGYSPTRYKLAAICIYTYFHSIMFDKELVVLPALHQNILVSLTCFFLDSDNTPAIQKV